MRMLGCVGDDQPIAAASLCLTIRLPGPLHVSVHLFRESANR